MRPKRDCAGGSLFIRASCSAPAHPMVAGEPTVPFERVLAVKRVVINDDFPDAQLHLYSRRGVQYVDAMDLIGAVNESASFDETQRVFRGLGRLFDAWEASGDFQWLMLHEFDRECGVTFPAGLRLVEIMWCAGPKRLRGEVERILRQEWQGGPEALQAGSVADERERRLAGKRPKKPAKGGSRDWLAGPVMPPAAFSKDELLQALDEVDPEWLEEVTGQPGAKRARRD